MFLGLNEKAWAGLNIMVFGKTPLLPMKIEQAFAKASPSNEVRIDSFEDYDQAYDFCKAQKNVGFIFMLENSGDPLAADTFKEFGLHYESKGWPCFGVLLHENEKSMLGYLSMQRNKNLLSYYSIEDILDPQKTFNTITEIWTSFVSAFEKQLIPEKLQETLLSLAEPALSAESNQFRNRLSVLLSQNLNISWLESIALKWYPVVSVLKGVNPKALIPNTALVQIADMAAQCEGINDVMAVIQAKQNLCSRLAAAIRLLEDAKVNATLPKVLDDLATHVRPGGPALLKHIVKSKDQILSIVSDHNQKGMVQVG